MKCRKIAILLSSSGCAALAAAACAGSGEVNDGVDGGGATSPDGGGSVLREGGGPEEPEDDSGSSSSNKDGGSDGSSGAKDAGPAKRLFVTKALFSGNFGSVANGDGLCQTAATAANLGGSWKAWLSDATKGARAHVGANGPAWALVDGSMVFNQTTVMVPVRDLDVDETGTAGNKGFVWTGTNGGGTATANTCSDWQGSGSATTGYPHQKDQWTDDNSNGTPCNFKGHLYCFEQ
jgi:hypothetical protein